jgi:outer membrane protein OmpA-like peptidoglycan-associated protein/tetratricopeptide (TPR) repeat protein
MRLSFIPVPLLILVLSSCSYTIKIRDGRTAFERKQFATAIPMLRREFEKADLRRDRGQLAFLIGESYRHAGQDDKALEWYGKAYEYNFGSEAMKAKAYALKRTEQYPEARETFRTLGIEIGSRYEYRKEITACDIAENWVKDIPNTGWSLQPVAFNSAQNDFAPARYPDGRIVFTTDRNTPGNREKYSWTGNRYMNLMVAEADNASPQFLFATVPGSLSNIGVCNVNNNGTELFFSRSISYTKSDDAFNKLFVCSRTSPDEEWSAPEQLPFQKDRVNYMHPALSADGNTLFFSANDPDGWGGYDLCAMQRNPRKESGWEEPVILGRNVNSSGNEVFPTTDADTLYFSSDGLPGMGGLDIFKTYRTDRGWTPPFNLKAPVNSGYDDFSFLVLANAPKNTFKRPGELIRSGLMTSNRKAEGAKGGDDIYRFEQRIPLPRPIPPDTPAVKTVTPKLILDVYVLENILADPEDPNSLILGRKPLPGATVNADFSGKKLTFNTDNEGMYRLEMPENTDYTFLASFPGYLSNNARFSSKGIARDPNNPVQYFEVEIVLDQIYRQKEIVLENIYYDYDKWDIRKDAEPSLDRLAGMLRQNADIKIQLGSHTDCRGNDAYNLALSQKRAQSAVNYLISKGIDPSRLTAVGYGETSPAASCACARCTEAEHQLNRRTTFKIE